MSKFMTKYYYEMIATYKSWNKSEITYENAENEFSKINIYFKDLDYIYITAYYLKGFLKYFILLSIAKFRLRFSTNL